MDLNDSAEEAQFRQLARDWINTNKPAEPLDADIVSQVEPTKKWQRKKYEAGWAAIGWPEQFGGRGASSMEQVIWDQEIERSGAPRDRLFSMGLSMAGPVIMAHGTEQQQEKYLKKIATGEQIWCQLFSEPSAGSDLAGIRTKAEPVEKGWIINGQKVWNSYAHIADMAILVARTDPYVPKHKGLSYFLLDMKSEGVDVRPIKQITGDSEFNEVFLEDVFIPTENLVGEVGGGWKVILSTLSNERLMLAEGSEYYLKTEQMVHLLKALELCDNGSELGAEHCPRLADWYVTETGLKYTNLRILSALSRGAPPGPEGSVGKLVSTNQSLDMANFALDVLAMNSRGANRFSDIFDDFLQSYLFVPGLRVAGGTDEIQLNIIAERILGMPADIRLDKDKPFREPPSEGSIA